MGLDSNNVFSKQGMDYRELLRPYLKHWKWFAGSVFLAVLLAVVYLRYTIPEYAVQAKIQILQDQSATSELSAFRDLGILTGGGANTQVEDEIEILNSRTNFMEVARQLGLNVTIKALGTIMNSELYTNPPFKLIFRSPDSVALKAKGKFKLLVLSETSFSLTEEIEGEEMPSRNYDFGGTIQANIGEFVITPITNNVSGILNREYEIAVRPLSEVAQVYKTNMVISITNELSNIISITLNDAIPEKSIDIMNGLINNYNQNAVDDKKAIADRTAEFINDRIADIYGELSTVDSSAEEFKTNRGITDVASQANINLNAGVQSQQELRNAEIQLNIAASMKDIMDTQSGYDILPANIGLSDGTVASTVARYNELVLERERLLKSSNERNPIIVNLNEQLDALKSSLQSSLSGMTNNLTLQVNNLSGQLSQINSRIYAAPRNERALRDIARQQQTTEALYLYLLQKREESQITYASATPKSKIIDKAYRVGPDPVSPRKPVILLAAFILGVVIPFSVIYGRQLFDNRVHNKVELEKLVGNIPVLAELPQLKRKEANLVKSGDRTVLAESLRILRTNLDYLIKTHGSKNGGNIVFVTSSVPGEGKTLMASNLAMIYAKANKKVLLLGADIRNPKLNQFYSGKDADRIGRSSRKTPTEGLTDYLVNRDLTVSEITSNMLVSDQMVDIIYSGKLMPNPAELLMSERMEELFDDLRRKYDYIIVDTAPMIVVSDTQLISKYADQILYVTRANFTELKVLEFPLKLQMEGKLKNLSFVVNGVKDTNLGYGGKYGYGYGKPVKKWWQFAS